jgi:ketosteroid isomerase-like protein
MRHYSEQALPTIWPATAIDRNAQRQPDACWWPALFSAIDARDADVFASFLTRDVQFRFGNAPLVTGREAVHETVTAFFNAIAGCRHRLTGVWQERGSFVCEGEVTYTRLDARIVTVPFANCFAMRGGEIASYRIYIDNGPLFAP